MKARKKGGREQRGREQRGRVQRGRSERIGRDVGDYYIYGDDDSGLERLVERKKCR